MGCICTKKVKHPRRLLSSDNPYKQCKQLISILHSSVSLTTLSLWPKRYYPSLNNDLKRPKKTLENIGGDIEDEEQKDHEKYVQPSAERQSEAPNNTLNKIPGEKKTNQSGASSKHEDVVPDYLRRHSEFNLDKDLNESAQRGLASVDQSNSIDRAIKNPDDDMQKERVQSEESVCRITGEQHSQIVEFVQETYESMQKQIENIFENLATSQRESEKLPMLMANIKKCAKDIENSMDDLKAHPFVNDKTLFKKINSIQDILSKVSFEYDTYKKNLKYYTDFREFVIELLKDYNPRLADTYIAVVISNATNSNNLTGIGQPKIMPDSLLGDHGIAAGNGTMMGRELDNNHMALAIDSNGRSLDEKGSMVFVPREDTRKSETTVMRDESDPLDFGLGQMCDYETNNNVAVRYRNSHGKQLRNSNSQNTVLGSLYPHDATPSMRGSYMPEDNAATNYERMKEDFDKVEEDAIKFKRGISTLCSKFKSYEQASSQPDSEEYNQAKHELVTGYLSVQAQIEQLREDLKDIFIATVIAYDKYKYEEGGMKIKQLENQAQEQREEIEEMVLQFKTKFKEFEQTNPDFTEKVQEYKTGRASRLFEIERQETSKEKLQTPPKRLPTAHDFVFNEDEDQEDDDDDEENDIEIQKPGVFSKDFDIGKLRSQDNPSIHSPVRLDISTPRIRSKLDITHKKSVDSQHFSPDDLSNNNISTNKPPMKANDTSNSQNNKKLNQQDSMPDNDSERDHIGDIQTLSVYQSNFQANNPSSTQLSLEKTPTKNQQHFDHINENIIMASKGYSKPTVNAVADSNDVGFEDYEQSDDSMPNVYNERGSSVKKQNVRINGTREGYPKPKSYVEYSKSNNEDIKKTKIKVSKTLENGKSHSEGQENNNVGVGEQQNSSDEQQDEMNLEQREMRSYIIESGRVH